MRRNGQLRRPTPIRVVCAGDDLYVRAAYMDGSGWRGVARASRAHISASGIDKDVAVEDADQSMLDEVDAAYGKKYGRRYASIVDKINDPEHRATTLRLLPGRPPDAHDHAAAQRRHAGHCPGQLHDDRARHLDRHHRATEDPPRAALSATALAWVQNAYLLTFGDLLLLDARAGDLIGRRRVFIIGLGLFTVASMAVGTAQSEAWLIAHARSKAPAPRSSRRQDWRCCRPASTRARAHPSRRVLRSRHRRSLDGRAGARRRARRRVRRLTVLADGVLHQPPNRDHDDARRTALPA